MDFRKVAADENDDACVEIHVIRAWPMYFPLPPPSSILWFWFERFVEQI